MSVVFLRPAVPSPGGSFVECSCCMAISSTSVSHAQSHRCRLIHRKSPSVHCSEFRIHGRAETTGTSLKLRTPMGALAHAWVSILTPKGCAGPSVSLISVLCHGGPRAWLLFCQGSQCWLKVAPAYVSMAPPGDPHPSRACHSAQGPGRAGCTCCFSPWLLCLSFQEIKMHDR